MGYCKNLAKVKGRKSRKERKRKGGGGCVTVEMKMKKLQRLVPGGSRLKPERLFVHTAEHILQLRLQLHVLQTLLNIFQP